LYCEQRELRMDCRPATEWTAAGRCQEPSSFAKSLFEPAEIDMKALDGVADDLLDARNDLSKGVAVIGIARQRLCMDGELHFGVLLLNANRLKLSRGL
jgi:hypothetical protein